MADKIDLSAWAKAEMQRIKRKIENMKYVVDLDGKKPPLPDPGPERVFQTDYTSEILITEMYEQLIVSGGDPDGMPMRALVQFKAGMADAYIAEADRLRSEISRLQPRKSMKEFA